MSEPLTTKELWSRAVGLLARREYSAKELADKLTALADPEQVADVLQQLTDQGYQSDQRFTDSFIRMRIGQGHGENRIRFDLQRKGIAAELIAQCLEEQEADWFELALEQYRRKYRDTTAGSDYKERAKRMRFMSQRGFSMDQISYAETAVAEEIED